MSSKYDVVKVKVYLSESNYYVLSRYLLTKVLTFCKVPTSDAIRMSLEVKRYLVNAGMIQITPQVLYERIQTTMEAHGYGQSHAIYFPIITKIHQERIPIIVFVTGWGPCGKTRLARSLASCLNCNCVVNTEVLLTIEASARTLPATTSSSSHLTTSIQPDSTLGWLDQCRLVQSFVEDECQRSLDGGKLLIVEGTALNLSLYASYFTEDFAKENRAVVLAFLLKTSSEKDPLQHPVLQAEWSDRAPPAEVIEAHKDFCEQASSMCIHSTSDSARSARELDTAVYEFELSSTFAVADVATSMHNIVVARVLRQLASEEDGAG